MGGDRPQGGEAPGYLAGHWCDRGHVLFVVDGVLETELKDGRRFTLKSGMSYPVSDFGNSPHRSSTRTGVKLFIVDQLPSNEKPPSLRLHMRQCIAHWPV